EDLDHLPALGRAEGPALLDAHDVPRLHDAVGVMGWEPLADADDLLVERVLPQALHLDDDRLRLLGGDDVAYLRLAVTAEDARLVRGGDVLCGRLHGLARDGLAGRRARRRRAFGGRGPRRLLRRLFFRQSVP